MRRALQGIVPDAILRRKSKGSYEGMFLESLRTCAGCLLGGELWLARLGWVAGRQTEARLARISDGMACTGQIQQVIRLEHWIRQNLRRGVLAAGEAEVSEMGIGGSSERALWGTARNLKLELS